MAGGARNARSPLSALVRHPASGHLHNRVRAIRPNPYSGAPTRRFVTECRNCIITYCIPRHTHTSRVRSCSRPFGTMVMLLFQIIVMRGRDPVSLHAAGPLSMRKRNPKAPDANGRMAPRFTVSNGPPLPTRARLSLARSRWQKKRGFRECRICQQRAATLSDPCGTRMGRFHCSEISAVETAK